MTNNKDPEVAISKKETTMTTQLLTQALELLEQARTAADGDMPLRERSGWCSDCEALAAAIRAHKAAQPEPVVPEIICVLAEWEDKNGTICGITPAEWAELMTAVTEVAIHQSPRQVRAVLAAAPTQRAVAQAIVPSDCSANSHQPAPQPLSDEWIEDEWERITGHSIFGGSAADGRTMYLSPNEVKEFARTMFAAAPTQPAPQPLTDDHIDATRYRWLRQRNVIHQCMGEQTRLGRLTTLDAAVDEAMAQDGLTAPK
jgi:hypothetical protein